MNSIPHLLSALKAAAMRCPPPRGGVRKLWAGGRFLEKAGALVLGLSLLSPGLGLAGNDFSPAEQALFLDNHMAKLKPPLTLHYGYRKSGSLEAAFGDTVDVVLSAQANGSCCATSARFLSGERQMRQPEVDSAEGNPAILYFLERDIREMQRLTGGKANYFRKRIRMAVYEGASIRKLTLPYRGHPVAVREISISPYRDDPNRSRYEKLANKEYVFMLSDEVPGGLYAIRTRIIDKSADAPPLIVEEMLADGAESGPAKRQP
jgi:hypothetical protein